MKKTKKDILHGGGLARAVGVQEAVDAAARDPQVQVVDGVEVAVGLRQAVGDDDQIVGAVAPGASGGLRRDGAGGRGGGWGGRDGCVRGSSRH